MTSPSFSMSVPDDSRVALESASRSRIIASTVMLPTIARRCPANSCCTCASIRSWPSRKRRAALAIEAKSSATLKIATPRTPTGIPWWVTHSIASAASRIPSDRRRTVWRPGRTSVPLPVTILKPRLSLVRSVPARAPRPEMMSASFGSATRHISLNRIANAIRAATAAIATTSVIPTSICSPSSPRRRSAGADHDGPRRVVLDDDDAAAAKDGLPDVGAGGHEGLRPAPDRDHHLARSPGRDRLRDASGASYHRVVVLSRSDSIRAPVRSGKRGASSVGNRILTCLTSNR
jgi:hypothetical protein